MPLLMALWLVNASHNFQELILVALSKPLVRLAWVTGEAVAGFIFKWVWYGFNVWTEWRPAETRNHCSAGPLSATIYHNPYTTTKAYN